LIRMYHLGQSDTQVSVAERKCTCYSKGCAHKVARKKSRVSGKRTFKKGKEGKKKKLTQGTGDKRNEKNPSFRVKQTREKGAGGRKWSAPLK